MPLHLSEIPEELPNIFSRTPAITLPHPESGRPSIEAVSLSMGDINKLTRGATHLLSWYEVFDCLIKSGLLIVRTAQSPEVALPNSLVFQLGSFPIPEHPNQSHYFGIHRGTRWGARSLNPEESLVHLAQTGSLFLDIGRLKKELGRKTDSQEPDQTVPYNRKARSKEEVIALVTDLTPGEIRNKIIIAQKEGKNSYTLDDATTQRFAERGLTISELEQHGLGYAAGKDWVLNLSAIYAGKSTGGPSL